MARLAGKQVSDDLGNPLLCYVTAHKVANLSKHPSISWVWSLAWSALCFHIAIFFSCLGCEAE